jgi:hypothetical protein
MTRDEFRSELEEITQNTSADEWWPEIEDLQQQFPHTIRTHEHETSEPYTCFMYAFRLHTSSKHREICEALGASVFADTCFFLFLKKRGVLRSKNPSSRQPGDLVVYINHGLPIHIGVTVAEGRVISKWGTGLLLEHDILEVPASYGKEIEAYGSLDYEAVENLFIQYANFIGGSA